MLLLALPKPCKALTFHLTVPEALHNLPSIMWSKCAKTGNCMAFLHSQLHNLWEKRATRVTQIRAAADLAYLASHALTEPQRKLAFVRLTSLTGDPILLGWLQKLCSILVLNPLNMQSDTSMLITSNLNQSLSALMVKGLSYKCPYRLDFCTVCPYLLVLVFSYWILGLLDISIIWVAICIHHPRYVISTSFCSKPALFSLVP